MKPLLGRLHRGIDDALVRLLYWTDKHPRLRYTVVGVLRALVFLGYASFLVRGIVCIVYWPTNGETYWYVSIPIYAVFMFVGWSGLEKQVHELGEIFNPPDTDDEDGLYNQPSA